MKKAMLFLLVMMIGAPVMAEDQAARQAQCEAWAAEDGLKGQEAKDYVAYCLEDADAQGSEAPASKSSD